MPSTPSNHSNYMYITCTASSHTVLSVKICHTSGPYFAVLPIVASPNISLATSLARLAPMRTLMSEIPKASLIMFETRCKPVLEWSRPLTCGNKTQLARGNK